MKRINKKSIIYLCIIILVIGIYYVFIRKEDYIESASNTLNLDKEISKNEDDFIDTKEKDNIVVYITGEVNNVGLYELQENSRVADIIDKAGGLTKEADIENMNLADILEDGMKIYVPKKSERLDENQNDNSNKQNNANIDIIKESRNINEQKNINKEAKSSKININTASQTELETLPGIGPSTALKIIEYRKQNGKFSCVEDIKNVSGIGESKYNKVKDLIKV